MEGPMWNGKYINQVFIRLLVIWLVVLSIIYIASNKNKKNVFYVAVILFATLWIFLDVFSTINQKRMYSTVVANKDSIMKN
jgi:hypothetical protein